MNKEEARAMGLTARMRRYCLEHGLDGLRDRHFIWKPPQIDYHWNYRKERREYEPVHRL